MNKLFVRALCAGIFSISILGMHAAHAGAIFQPVDASTNMSSFTTFGPELAIDQSGLVTNYTSGVTDFDAFTSTTHTFNGGASSTTWFSLTSLTGHFDFDLGASVTLQSLALWADPQGIGQGVNSFNLLADDNAAFSSPTVLGSFSAADGDGTAIPDNITNFGQVFSFAPTTASFIRMEILSNHGSTLTTGFVEAAFELADASTPISEPSILMLMGLGLTSLIGFRRKRNFHA